MCCGDHVQKGTHVWHPSTEHLIALSSVWISEINTLAMQNVLFHPSAPDFSSQQHKYNTKANMAEEKATLLKFDWLIAV